MIPGVFRSARAQKIFQRFLEIIPGSLVWLTLIAGVVLSFTNPIAVIAFIILFDLYWLLRVIYFVIILSFAWRQYECARHTDWLSRARAHAKFSSITHVIFLPFVSEGADIVDATLTAIRESNYPIETCIVVLAGEERAKANFRIVMDAMKKKHEKSFFALLATLHPADLPDEIVSKGANLNYSGHEVKKFIDTKKIPYESIIVSALDVDTIVHRDYFACVTDAYLSHPTPTHASYQPVVLFNNNIWTAPAPMRLAALSTTFWLMSELARPDRLFTFSSHSMSFQALVDVDFWQKDIVSEDSRIFLQCFLRYHGNYNVVPIYVPVSMDTVVGKNIKTGLMNLYKQQRRWAWGVEHFPYMIQSFLRDPILPLGKKISLMWNQSEGMYTWATAPLIILILGRLPLIVVNRGDHITLLAQNAPYILETLLNLSMVGILVIGFISFFLLPPQPATQPRYRKIFMVLQWLLLPISIIFFSALPAIDAQTRLMFGRYLEFNVTEKKRILP